MNKPENSKSSLYYFGCRCWHPEWIQILANAKFYTFCLCFAAIVEGAIVSGKLNTKLSTSVQVIKIFLLLKDSLQL